MSVPCNYVVAAEFVGDAVRETQCRGDAVEHIVCEVDGIHSFVACPTHAAILREEPDTIIYDVPIVAAV